MRDVRLLPPRHPVLRWHDISRQAGRADGVVVARSRSPHAVKHTYAPTVGHRTLSNTCTHTSADTQYHA